MIASIELQKALFNLLSIGNYPVYELVPKDENYPYISFRLQSKTNNYTKTNQQRYTFNVYVHSWSQSSSSLESKTMDSFIHDAIMGTWLIDGYDVEFVELIFSETLTETDVTHNIFQGIQEFKITINEEEGVV